MMIQSIFFFLNKNEHEFNSKSAFAENEVFSHILDRVPFDSEEQYFTNLQKPNQYSVVW